MAKSVLLAQLSEEQSLMWHSVLSSHQLEVWAAPETEDLLKMLDQKYQAKQPLPELIISDIGIRYGGGTSLLATELCKWCADNAPELKVLLVNPRQVQIKEVEKRWATRRGAIACHQIVTQQHHGKIVLRSPYLNNKGDVTIGTEFEVLLPI